MKTHEFADFYPFMSDEDLQDLADDIKNNGLIHPLIVKDGVLVDGRNRLKACEMAGVDPVYKEFDGDEDAIKGFIISMNNNRRHLSSGQKAMAYAQAYPEPERGKRNDLCTENISSTISANYIYKSRYILKHVPDFVSQVMIGTMPLTEAYKQSKYVAEMREIHDRKRKEQEIEEAKKKEIEELAEKDQAAAEALSLQHANEKYAEYVAMKLEPMRLTHNELVDAVNDGKMTLDAAVSKYEDYLEGQRVAYSGTIMGLENMADSAKRFMFPSGRKTMKNVLKTNLEAAKHIEAVQQFLYFIEELNNENEQN